ncbi:hypothetical protein QJQ45_028478 [Haematococcus lacustris]|nr:hypothetical protein QJQ45_028478 [Haematococcus lacustris]
MAKKKRRSVPRLVPEDLGSDIEDRDEALQPDLTEAERNRKVSGEARAARDRDNTYHGRKCKLAHLIDHLPQELWDAFLDDAVQPRVEAISERAVLASLLFGLLVRGLFTIHVADPLGLHDQPVYTDIPVSQAAIPDLSCRNLFLQLVRGLPGNGANTQPNAAVAAVLAAHPDLRDRLAAIPQSSLPRQARVGTGPTTHDVLGGPQMSAISPETFDVNEDPSWGTFTGRLDCIPRHHSDCNMVDHVGKQLETAFSNMLTVLFTGRLKKSVSLAGAKVLLGTEEHRRRFGFWGLVGGHLPAWSKRQCTYVRRMVCGLDVSWLVGEGGVVVTEAMQAEVALQRGLLGLEEGEEVDDDWVEDPANRGRLLRHRRKVSDLLRTSHSRLIRTCNCALNQVPGSACLHRHSGPTRHMIRDAGMLGVLTEEGVTSLKKFRNGALPDPARPGHYIEGPKDSHVANRWNALLPDPRRQKLASPKHSFAQIVHTDGVALSVMFLRPKPAAPPADPPRMGRHMGAVNPLAHLDAEWLGVDPGKTNMATVAHEERSAAGTVVSVWQRSLTAGQYYRDSGITRQAQATKKWLAQVKPQLNALSHVSSKPSSLASYRRFADTVLATYDAMWAEVSKPRWANAKFRLYCGKKRVVAGFWSKVRPISKAARTQAKEQRNMMVLMPHFLNDIHPSMSEAFLSLYLLQDSEGDTIKYHMMGHVVDTIRDMGGMMDVHAQFFEASHRNVKLWYRLTNKRQRNNTEAMVSRARLLMMAHACDADALGVPQYETAHSIATSRGEHTVVQQSQRMDVELASSAGCNLLSQQPELRQLSTLLQEACATLHMAMPVFINVVNTAVLAASVDWEPDCSVAQTVRATPCFYNRPWFDNVALNTEPETFAQLRLLSTAGDMKLAMVRCYQELPPKEQAANVLSKHGNTRLRGVPVSQMLKEALRQFPAGRVVMVDEFRTSRVSSAYSHPSEALPGQPPESFMWLRPVYSEAKRSQVRGLMCSTCNNIRFYDRDVSAALNIRRCAVGPGPRPTELCYWDGRPAMPKLGRPGQEWQVMDRTALLLECLRSAIDEPDLVEDIAEACQLGDIGVSELASVENLEVIEQKLFLTPQEARKLRTACQLALASAPLDAAEAASKTSKFRPTSAPCSRSSAPSHLQHPVSSPHHGVKAMPRGSPSTPPSVKTIAGMSRLLAPTAAFLSRVMGHQADSKQARTAKETALQLRASQKLDAVLAAPQGQRVTKPAAFSLGSSKPTLILSSEEAELLEAKKHAFKPLLAPKHLHAPVAIDGFARTQSAPANPSQCFKPFRLSSVAKHEEYQKMRAQRLAAEQAKAEQARLFKAQVLDKTVLTAVPSPRKPAPMPITSPVAPKLASELRVEHWKEVLGPARRARMDQVEREKLEAAERHAAEEAKAEADAAAAREAAKAQEAELHAMSVAQLRKTMEFKARRLPDFSSPFKPDHSKSPAVTKSMDFSLKTDARLGRALGLKDRQDAAAPCMTDYTSSLRASGTFAPGSPAGAQGALRRSVVPHSPRGSGHKPKVPASPSAMLRASLQTSKAAGSPASPLAAHLSEALQAALGAKACKSPGDPASCTHRTAAGLVPDSPRALAA